MIASASRLPSSSRRGHDPAPGARRCEACGFAIARARDVGHRPQHRLAQGPWAGTSRPGAYRAGRGADHRHEATRAAGIAEVLKVLVRLADGGECVEFFLEGALTRRGGDGGGVLAQRAIVRDKFRQVEQTVASSTKPRFTIGAGITSAATSLGRGRRRQRHVLCRQRP
jgi:hypothetical protein